MMTMMSRTNGGSNSSSNNNKYPFTASQWQELENQALIFKYMACGYPIPSDLILHIRRSVLMDSTTAASLFPLQPSIGGWGYYQMSSGRKAEDPEPGRCRRTDGKKWRCSKEACQDSKYCERHMHRGKNRSRKPVEMSLNPSSNNSSNGTNTYSGSSSIAMPMTPASENNQPSSYPYGPYSSYSIRPPAMSLTTDRDWRYYHGFKAAEMEQYTCFSESSEGGERDSGGSWRFTPLGMSSLGESKQQRRRFGNEEKNQNQYQSQNQDCFVLGTTDLEFKLGRDEDETHHHPKPIRHFFNDWSSSSSSLKSMGYEEEEDQSSFSKTQLSISIPATVNHQHHHQQLLHNLSKDDTTKH